VAVLALVAVSAVWGLTFVQVKDAVEIYPLFAFLAVRFAIACVALAPAAARRALRLPREGWIAGAVLGAVLALGYVLQTAGLERTTVSSAGFVTGMYVVLTPLLALALFRVQVALAAWLGVALSLAGLGMLAGIHAGSPDGDLLVLGGAAAFALQIVLMERYAPRYDPLAFTLAELAAALACFLVVALARGELDAPHGATVWGALLVTGILASALAFLVQSWAQQRTSATRTALLFALEPVFAGVFGYALAGDRLGAVGWAGCVVILAGIALAEPAAAAVLVRLLRSSGGGAAGESCRPSAKPDA
jgi:drug/metabolite transporter (DMT)-like permease